jgi:hypothetical protein
VVITFSTILPAIPQQITSLIAATTILLKEEEEVISLAVTAIITLLGIRISSLTHKTTTITTYSFLATTHGERFKIDSIPSTKLNPHNIQNFKSKTHYVS